MLYVLLPPVIFFNIASSHIDVNHGVGLLLGLLASSLGALTAYLLASRVLRLSRARTGAVVCTVLSVNTGYLGYPLTVALLGRDQLPTAVLYDVLVTGPCLLLGAFAVGAALGTKAGEGPRERVRAFFTRNPPLYAAIAGLLAPDALAPQVLVDLSQVLAGGDPADRLLRRRRNPGRERRARRPADAAAADQARCWWPSARASSSCRPC